MSDLVLAGLIAQDYKEDEILLALEIVRKQKEKERQKKCKT